MQVVASDIIVARGPLGVGVKNVVAVTSGVGVNVGGSGVGEEGAEVGAASEFRGVVCAERFTGVSVLVADVDGPQAEIKTDAAVTQNNKRTFMNAP